MSKNKPVRMSRAWRAVCVILAVVLLLGVAVAGVVQFYLSKIDRYTEEDDYTLSADEIQQMEDELRREEGIVTEDTQTEEPSTAPTEAPTEATTEAPTEATTEPTEVTEPVKKKEREVVNILLIGQDSRGGTRGRSDVMLLCSVNTKEKTITMTSFMRDLYVNIPGNGANKLNAAYAYGGKKLLNETLLENFGVEVDANIEINFNNFELLIDWMGGVTVSLTQAEVNHLAEYYDYHHLVVGRNDLNGEEALAYSRIRQIDSDFQRTSRQRKVLSSLFEKVRNMDLIELMRVADVLLPLVKTDMRDVQMVNYLMQFWPMLEECELISQRVPMDNGYVSTTIDGRDVLVPDMEMTREMLEDTAQ